MEAGSELDALVAEKVMGLEPWPEQDPRWECKAFKAPIVPFGVEPKPCSPPEYSTDIAAAWAVVEKCFGKEFALKTYDNGWAASYRWRDSDPYSSDCCDWVYAETAPHAICLAALRASGVEL